MPQDIIRLDLVFLQLFNRADQQVVQFASFSPCTDADTAYTDRDDCYFLCHSGFHQLVAESGPDTAAFARRADQRISSPV